MDLAAFHMFSLVSAYCLGNFQHWTAPVRRYIDHSGAQTRESAAPINWSRVRVNS